ncbi:MAG: cell division protein ZapA [Muribaculaceae bacterium]|nr:cell division protein ZapA [Muribaculaceae bacterium]MDE6754946.1 cell division protein ZapA [Muribaculaceae bacterium]
MNETDKVKMTINIGGEHLQVAVPFNRQDVVRDAEKAVAQLIDAWKLKWPKHSDSRLLAMAAYQFAISYQDLLALHQEAAERAGECDSLLEALIRNEE